MLTRPQTNVRCPITSFGQCRFVDQIVSGDWPKPMVFYAFDTATDQSRERQLQSRAIRQAVQLAVGSCGVELYEFDRATVGPSSDWLCQKVCLPIQNAALVIADISSYDDSSRYKSNPNVTFEAGMAWGFRKNLMLINGSDGKVVADFSGIEYFRFPTDFDNKRFQDNLRKFVADSRLSSGFQLISSRVNKVRLLHEVEMVRGDWLLASDYPSFLFRPLSNLKRLATKNADSAAEGKERVKLVEQRWFGFRRMLDETDHAFLHLYEKDGFETYFRTGMGRRTSPDMEAATPEEREAELNETIELLKTHFPKLQIGFTSSPIPYAFLLRPGSCVYIDSKSDLDHTLHGIFCTYQSVLDDLGEIFKRYWAMIAPGASGLDGTLMYLEQMKAMIERRAK